MEPNETDLEYQRPLGREVNMQIGVGKSGVKIGEYANKQEGMGTLGWIEPACSDPQWIMWFDSKGDALLYTKRGPTGGAIGDPIHVRARGSHASS
jgi:hypothetical protein